MYHGANNILSVKREDSWLSRNFLFSQSLALWYFYCGISMWYFSSWQITCLAWRRFW